MVAEPVMFYLQISLHSKIPYIIKKRGVMY